MCKLLFKITVLISSLQVQCEAENLLTILFLLYSPGSGALGGGGRGRGRGGESGPVISW